MDESLRLFFFGSLSNEQLDASPERVSGYVQELERAARKISREIESEISEIAGRHVRVEIRFREGSLEWLGSVELRAAIWQGVEAMADVGGAIALLQLVAPAVNRVLRRWFSRLFGYGRYEDLNTRVVIGPAVPSTSPRRNYRGNLPEGAFLLFGVAAVIASLAALVAASAAVVAAVARLVQ